MRYKIFYILIIIVLSAYTNLSAQNNLIIVEHADKMVDSLGSTYTRTCEGNVRFTQGNIKVSCDWAKLYVNQNYAELRGDVVVLQDSMRLESPFVNYDGNKNIARAKDSVVIFNGTNTVLRANSGEYSTETMVADFFTNVSIVNDSVNIVAKHIEYNRNNQHSYAFGKVNIHQIEYNTLLFADTVLNKPDLGFTYSSGNPILLKIDTNERENKYDTLYIVSRVMEAQRGDKDIYTFTDSVEFVRAQIFAKSGKAYYQQTKGYISLEKNPIIWYDSTQLFSDSTVVFIDGDQLKSVEAHRNALSAMRTDTLDLRRINQISGDNLSIQFLDDTIRVIEGFGNTRSLYFLGDEKSLDGADQKSADSIKIKFSLGRPAKIIWLGGVKAKYYPEKMIEKDPSKYYLPGFRWRNDKPKKRTIEIN